MNSVLKLNLNIKEAVLQNLNNKYSYNHNNNNNHLIIFKKTIFQVVIYTLVKRNIFPYYHYKNSILYILMKIIF